MRIRRNIVMWQKKDDDFPMNLATLRVQGPDSSLEELKELLGLVIDAEWHAGDERRSGSVHEFSGFNATVADASTPKQMTELMRTFWARCIEKGVAFPWRGITAELAVGLAIGDSTQFVAGIELVPSDISLCAECGMTLSVTAYPTSDEANAT